MSDKTSRTKPSAAASQNNTAALQQSYGSRRDLFQLGAAVAVAGVLTQGGKAKAARAVRLLALGDSLTAGYMLPERDGFPAVLERALRAAGQNVEVINAGVSGDTSSGGLDRVDWAIGDGVDCAIVELGANDMLRGIAPAVTRKALSDILAKLQARGVKVLLAGMYAVPGMGRDYEAQFNAIYPDLARQYGVALYPFFLQGMFGNADMALKDGMHPNAAGVRAVVQAILPTATALVQSVGARS